MEDISYELDDLDDGVSYVDGVSYELDDPLLIICVLVYIISVKCVKFE
jgi:hypothetical protein